MENNTVTIPKIEYENLIRDSEKVRILTQAVLDGADPGYWLGLILGVQQDNSENENVDRKERYYE